MRRRLLTPDASETTLEKRGFHRKSASAQDRLESVGKSFLQGYTYAMEAVAPAAAEPRLEQLPDWLRGFAYEGAGMGFAMLDGLPFGRSDNVQRFLQRPLGSSHRYLVLVGVGWAMARLPRVCWPDPAELDPLLLPLVLDGYGFHQAYFRTARYVDEQYRDPSFRWLGGSRSSYADDAIDQGIGRATWFVSGTDPDRVADRIDAFPESRRANLYSGVGLAATYAGGADRAELRTLVQRAGPYARNVAQASAFAAQARVSAGIVPEHTGLATEVLCGATPQDAARITEAMRPVGRTDGEVPAYEVWRRRVAEELVSVGGVNP